MLKNFLFLLLLNFFCSFLLQAQEKSYFDKTGKACSESAAYYYRIKSGDAYKSYYSSEGSLYFEGKILSTNPATEDKNLYSGICTWYYKNGSKKAVRNFNDKGQEDGLSVYYYENGNVWKEINFRNGNLVNNAYLELDELGHGGMIYEEEFLNNKNEWDIYSSDKSLSAIKNGKLELTAFTDVGTSRFIHHPVPKSGFSLEASLKFTDNQGGHRAGLIYGFKDWQNYHFFVISPTAFYIGSVTEGEIRYKAEGMYTDAISKEELNLLKVLANDEKTTFSINGSVQMACPNFSFFGGNNGVALSGPSGIEVEKIIFKEANVKSKTTALVVNAEKVEKTVASGFLVNEKGYVVTNYHGIADQASLFVELMVAGSPLSYHAVLVQKDAENDLAVLKIDDQSFASLPKQVILVKNGISEAGSSLFVTSPGKEAGATEGKITSKTGWNGAIHAYLSSLSLAAQNSGSPVFNQAGQWIGVLNVKNGESTNSVIKLSYVKNLLELLSEPVVLAETDKAFDALNANEKFRQLTARTCLIKVK